MFPVLLWSALALGAQGYTIQDLGTLSATPSDGVRAASIDNLGRVHAENDKSAPGGGGLQWRALLWDGQSSQEIFPPLMGSTWSGGLNDRGQVAGYYTAFGAGGAALPLHGYIWENGTLTDVIFGNHGFTRIFDINELGVTTGAYLSDDLFGFVFQNHAFVRAPNGNWLDLGTLGGRESRGLALNDRMQITGMARTPSDAHAGFFWESSSGMVDIGHLGGTFCSPEDINNHGQIVGQSNDALGQGRPFVWQSGSMIDLGTLGGTSGRAKGINDHGDVVGNALDLGGVQRAVIWPDGGAPIDLNFYLPIGSAWNLTGAHEINELGEICGTGLLNGVQRAYRLQPSLTEPRLSGFLPGLSAQQNTLRGLAFTPLAQVEIYAGLSTGSTTLGCGANLDIQNVRILGTTTTDADGRLAFDQLLPPSVAGRQVYLQAVETVGCRVGELRKQLLP